MQEPSKEASDLAEEDWDDGSTQPSFINLSAVIWIIVAGAVGALLAFVAYKVFQNPQLAERAKAFFERSSTSNFIFWIVAGLFIGFLLIAACELFSFCGGKDQDDENSEEPPKA